MFLAQGFAQWELWMGKAAPEVEMGRAVMAQLRADESAQNKEKVAQAR
jgi:shikimate 5-dehydrogenase